MSPLFRYLWAEIEFFKEITNRCGKLAHQRVVFAVMGKTNLSDPNPEKESAKRMLRWLRILLIIWLLSFIAIIIWFSISPN